MNDIRTILNNHYKEVRARLRNPPNAVPDSGIDLRRHRRTQEPETSIQTKPIELQAPSESSTPTQPSPTPVLTFKHPDTAPIPLRNATFFSSIVALTAAEFGMSVRDLKQKSRVQNVVMPRQVAMYIALQQGMWSIPWVARQFDKDHTTCIHARTKITKKIETDAGFRARFEDLSRRIEAFRPSAVPADCQLHLENGPEQNNPQEPILPQVD